jgi:hypothetical protein
VDVVKMYVCGYWQVLELGGFQEFMTVLREQELRLRRWADMALYKGVDVNKLKHDRKGNVVERYNIVQDFMVEKVVGVVEGMLK